MGEIQSAGGITIAQSRKTCVVFGMPKAAIERGYAMQIADLQDLPNILQAHCAGDRSSHYEGDVSSRSTSAGN